MDEIFTVDICGVKAELPVLPLPNGIHIAFFNLHGNQALTEHCGKQIAKRIAPFEPEVIITAESKGLQLAHVTARELGQAYYAVARKTKKLYMQDGIEVSVRSITTGEDQKLYISAHDAALMKNRRVAIVDDVISTGGSLKGLEALVGEAGGNIVVKATVLAEGAAADRKDIEYLARIPLL